MPCARLAGDQVGTLDPHEYRVSDVMYRTYPEYLTPLLVLVRGAAHVHELLEHGRVRAMTPSTNWIP